MAPSCFCYLNPWGEAGQVCTVFDWVTTPSPCCHYSLIPSEDNSQGREERKANYRISRGRRVIENAVRFYLFIYLGFYVAFNTVQVISRREVGRAEETSTYSSLEFCTVNCQPTLPAFPLEAVPGIEPRF